MRKNPIFLRTCPWNYEHSSKEKRKARRVIELDSIHNVYSDKGNIVGTINFSFEDRESSGTNKLFDLSGPIFETLYSGSVLVIDELDAKMHPLISQYIIELFNNPETIRRTPN